MGGFKKLPRFVSKKSQSDKSDKSRKPDKSRKLDSRAQIHFDRDGMVWQYYIDLYSADRDGMVWQCYIVLAAMEWCGSV